MSSVVLVLGLAAVAGGLAVMTLLVQSIMVDRRAIGRSLLAITADGVGSSRTPLPFKQRVLLPALDQFTALGEQLSPASGRVRLVRQLDLAGNPALWTVERLLAVKALGLLLAVAARILVFDGGAARTAFLTVLLAAGAFLLPDLLVYNSGSKRQAQIQKDLPDALDLLTISVEAGLGFDAALAQVARNTDGPLAKDLFRVLQEMQLQSRVDALRALGERTTVADLSTFVSSLVQADNLGIPIAQVLREQAKEMRLKRKQRAEEKAMKVPVKILIPMVVCILPVLFVIVLAPAGMELAKATQGG